MKKKTALLFLVHYGRGGSTLYLQNFVRVLSSEGYTVIALCRKHDGSESLMRECGARTLVVPISLALNVTALDILYSRRDRLFKLVKDGVKVFYGVFVSLFFILRFNPDLLLVGDYPLIPVIIAGKILRKDTLTLVQLNITKSRWKNWMTRKVILLCNTIICISPIHAGDFKPNETSRTRRFFIIPNSVESNLAISPTFQSYYEGLNVRTKNLILYVGGIESTKGVRAYLAIAQRVCTAREDVTFILAGGFHKRFRTTYAVGTSNLEYRLTDEITRAVEDNSFDDRIKIIGETRYVRELLNVSSFLLAPSAVPYFLRPVIEAWSVHKTAIVADDEFGRYLMENERTGLIAEKDDLDEWVRKTNMLLDDTVLYDQLRTRGYEKFVREYESEATKRRISEVLKIR